MEISFSRYIKDLGRLTSEELTAVFSRSYLTDDDKSSFVEMLKVFKNASDALEAVEYEKKPKSKPKIRATTKKIFREVIIKMRQKLEEYEQSDEIDEWAIYFTVGQDYSNIKMADIKAHHTRLAFRCYSFCFISMKEYDC